MRSLRPQARRGAMPMHIAIFRALQLGDMLCAVPAMRALREACADANITLIGLPWARSFQARFAHLLDDFEEFPGYPGLPEREVDVFSVPSFLARMQSRHFDLALQLHGSGSIVNELVALFGARQTAGFFEPGGYGSGLREFTPWPVQGSEIERLLHLTDHLGVPRRGLQLEFPVSQEEWASQQRLLEEVGIADGEYVCIHPGARLPSRRWPIAYFASVARQLLAVGVRVVLTGTADEASLTGAINTETQSRCVDLSGRTELGVLAATLARSRLLVCNDTGVSHVAAALRVPSVVICSGADASRWAPLDDRLHTLLFEPMPCRPCAHFECPIGHPCARNLHPARVWQAIERQLGVASSGERIDLREATTRGSVDQAM